MFTFLRKADHTTSRKTRKGRDLHNKCPGVELLEGRVVLDAAGSTLVTAQNIGAISGRPIDIHSLQDSFQDIGAISGRRTLSGFVGNSNPSDLYRFSFTNPGSLNVLLNNLIADADLRVLNAFGNVIASSNQSGTTADVVNLTSLAAGTYYAQVIQYGSAQTFYNLTLTADYAGNSTAAARNLGTFFGTRDFGDFVGAIDTNDFYQINLSTSRIVTGTISGLSADADLQLQDAFGNVITTSNQFGTANDSISRFLAPGTYYFRVYQFNGDTNYNFTLTT